MGIKYRDNSIMGVYAGGTPIRDVYMGNNPMWHNYLYDWNYVFASNGKMILSKYKGSYEGIVTVPNAEQVGRDVQIGRYVFTNDHNLVSIDLQGVLFQSANMYNSFYNCQNLQAMQGLPASGIVDMSMTFYRCFNFNQEITLPSTVNNMFRTFTGCINLSNSVRIPSSEVKNAVDCFQSGTSPKPKSVYIPFNYTGTTRRTATFNSFRTAGYISASGTSTMKDGTVFYNLPVTRGMRFDPPEEEPDMR